jgi:serine/threonine-protein kinase
MALPPGAKLGPYEIVSPLGAGGMGEVYRARDPRMKRDVAIKTSAERFSDRFEREVHAVAALNHLNICHIYDVGPNYLVLELVDGPTLADRIQRGPLPLDEALRIARQIGDALEAAHEKGIVHRDLKPANIKITPEGTVKVLDFGLAKMAEAVAVGGSPSESPTMAMGATIAGEIMGTAAYMAPEQARGKPVDKRADIWAFGVVLYEMLTGRRLFEGETISDTLAGVLTKEPDWKRVPATVRRLLRRCLEKDPKRRLRDIGDARLELDGGEDIHGQVPVADTRTRWRALPWGLALAATALAGWAMWDRGRADTTARHVMGFDMGFPPNVEPQTISTAPVALSPDGTTIAMIGVQDSGRRLFIRRFEGADADADAIELPGASGLTSVTFSPDGSSVALVLAAALSRPSLGRTSSGRSSRPARILPAVSSGVPPASFSAATGPCGSSPHRVARRGRLPCSMPRATKWSTTARSCCLEGVSCFFRA